MFLIIKIKKLLKAMNKAVLIMMNPTLDPICHRT